MSPQNFAMRKVQENLGAANYPATSTVETGVGGMISRMRGLTSSRLVRALGFTLALAATACMPPDRTGIPQPSEKIDAGPSDSSAEDESDGSGRTDADVFDEPEIVEDAAEDTAETEDAAEPTDIAPEDAAELEDAAEPSDVAEDTKDEDSDGSTDIDVSDQPDAEPFDVAPEDVANLEDAAEPTDIAPEDVVEDVAEDVAEEPEVIEETFETTVTALDGFSLVSGNGVNLCGVMITNNTEAAGLNIHKVTFEIASSNMTVGSFKLANLEGAAFDPAIFDTSNGEIVFDSQVVYMPASIELGLRGDGVNVSGIASEFKLRVLDIVIKDGAKVMTVDGIPTEWCVSTGE